MQKYSKILQQFNANFEGVIYFSEAQNNLESTIVTN